MWIHHYAPLTLLGRFLPYNGSSFRFIHRCYSHAVWRRRGIRIGLDMLIALFVWPLGALAEVGLYSWRNDAVIRQRTGKGLLRQAVEQLYLSLVYSMLPRWYYIFELYDKEKSRKASQYLHRFELKEGLYTILKAIPPGTQLSPLTDKVAFAARCRAHGLPAVPVILAGEREVITFCSSGSALRLSKIDLFVKPNHGKGGRGAERWEWQPSGLYKNTDGKRLTEAELIHHLQRLPFAEGYLVQPRVVNHPSLADLSTGALATVRVVTCRNEHGGFEATNAVFRMAQGQNAVVDNFHAGGLAAKVNLQSGELGCATDLGLRATTGWCATHPETGAPIVGRVLPFWTETLALACRAHAAFADRVIIGWDIAPLADGPWLIEGNGAPDLDIIQRTHQEPVGDMRLGQLLAFHLRQICLCEGRRRAL
jgi:hypothetical protein